MARGRKRKVKNSGSRVGAEKVQLDAETRRVRLKNLIVMGKERGYLIYSEINDHLPEDVLDAEQIDGIISMINDMGIQVYDQAPDNESLTDRDAFYICSNVNVIYICVIDMYVFVCFFISVNSFVVII